MSESTRPIAGVILAGGRSRRMGSDKAFVVLDGRPLISHAIARMAPQVDLLVINGDPQHFAALGLPVAADSLDGFRGPLAGILAGLDWVADHRPDVRLVVTTPVDAPVVPMDLVAMLAENTDGAGGIAVARSARGIHPVNAAIPVRERQALRDFILSSPSLSVRDWLATRRSVAVDFAQTPDGTDPFFNVNTPDDLASAERRLAG